MNIEMPEDLAEDIANKLGIYGACGDHHSDGWGDKSTSREQCRSCFVTGLTERIIESVKKQGLVGEENMNDEQLASFVEAFPVENENGEVVGTIVLQTLYAAKIADTVSSLRKLAFDIERALFRVQRMFNPEGEYDEDDEDEDEDEDDEDDDCGDQDCDSCEYMYDDDEEDDA